MKSNTSSTGRKVPGPSSDAVAQTPSADAEALLHKAHKVLVRYLPGAALPDDLSRVRAMLDAHMFGRDKRAHRDNVVEVARQIDRILPARLR